MQYNTKKKKDTIIIYGWVDGWNQWVYDLGQRTMKQITLASILSQLVMVKNTQKVTQHTHM